MASFVPMDPLTYLSRNPGASRKQVMKACGCSARDVRRAEDQLAVQVAATTNKGVLRLVCGGLVVLGVAALALSPSPNQEPPALAVESGPRRAAEAAIYSALDARDPSHAGEALVHLESDDESLRLAAIRYLATVDPEPHLDRLLPRADDPSRRVRIATIQLLGKVRAQTNPSRRRLGEALLRAALDTERELAERVVALTGLRPDLGVAPEQLLPALDERAVSAAASAALTRLTGHKVAQQDSQGLRAAWSQLLEADAK